MAHNFGGNSHPTQTQLELFAAGRLSSDESRNIEQHLDDCESCTDMLSALSVGQDPLVAKLRAAQPEVQSAGAAYFDQDTVVPQRSPDQDDTNSPSLDASADTPSNSRAEFAQRPPNAAGGSGTVPKTLGRYRIERLLGRGGFGEVYRAWDEQLRRPVAIKVTFQKFLSSDSQDSYLAEARIVASLDHPHIVPVYDVGQTDSGDYYVVSKMIDGSDLAGRLKTQRPSRTESVTIITSIAEALKHAHSLGLVHRDIKPANILIDAQGRAFLTDFGIALREEDFGRSAGLAGTPNYMSPEQARGEGHRVDGRSDLYSLGVVLYQLLTGRRPFQSDKALDVLRLIAENEVRPPRQLDETIPRELERICLKALALRASDRYASGSEFAEDLRCLSEQELGNSAPRTGSATGRDAMGVSATPSQVTPTGPTRVIPRGLRSFDQTDADFFLELLPGPVDRMGLPDSIRFWKQKAETKEPDDGFSVGLIYGPSGCGKSSLMKAGLLPRLSDRVVPVYIEATGDSTEQRLARAIQKKIPALSGDRGLKDTLTAIRRGQGLPAGKALLLVIDQFEQWLHANEDYRNTELTAALRQCDGLQVRCIVMVRDDFWLSVSRFMKELEVDIEASNSRLVDLFHLDHAARVLGLFGKAFGKLSDSSSKWTVDQQEFVKQAVAGLAQDRKVVCVRLALFAEMMKSRDWTTAALKEVGGTAGVGVTFLEETFSSRTAHPQHRQHQAAARGVLQALLPMVDTDIKGHMRSQEELLEASGYTNRPDDFTALLRILDGELRLITPTDPEGDSLSGNSSRNSSLATRFYQLTHDYLVPSLREWLTRKQKETRKGRAELKLEERTALWTAKPENRYLPSLREWIGIRWLTDQNKWTDWQRKIMQKAGRLHLLRSGSIAAILLVAGLTLQFILAGQKAASLVEALKTASPEQLTTLIQQADESRRSLDPLLQPLIDKANETDAAPADRAAALPARLVLADRDPSQVKPLSDALLNGDLAYVEPIRTRLRQYANDLRPQWLDILQNDQESNSRRFRAALGLAGLDGEQSQTRLTGWTGWTGDDLRFVAGEMASSYAEYQPLLRNLLRPKRLKLIPAFQFLCDAETASEDQQHNAAMALADYADADAELMAQLLTRATARQAEILYPKVAEFKSGPVRDGLLALTKEQPLENFGQLDRVRLGRRRANAALTLLRQGERDAYFDALRITDDPESLSQFVARCRKWGVTPEELLESLQRSSALRQSASGEAKKIESRVMYGLLLALGSYAVEQIPNDSREALFVRLRDLYEKDPSASIHSASGWLLRHWGRLADVQKIDEQEVPYDPTGERDWFRLRLEVTGKPVEAAENVTPPTEKQSRSLTFVVFPAGEYRLGSPEFAGGELERYSTEVPRVVKISRPVALCDREVTWALYDLFEGGQWRTGMQSQWGWDLSDNDAVFGRNWYDWVEFCRWLTREWRGDAESWQCYPDAESLEKDGNGDPVYGEMLLDRRGFRMPTESEWELGARSGQRTAYAFGGDVSLLSDYGWFQDNSGKRPRATAVKPPTIGGLFDAHGSLYEWTHDCYVSVDSGSSLVDPQGAVLGGSYRVSRGGSWIDVAARCRTADRNSFDPTFRIGSNGFRLALSLPSVQSPEADK